MSDGELRYILIDPQKGFTDSTGSLAKAYGLNELTSICETSSRILKFLSSGDTRTNAVIITSEYQSGQFNSDPCHPLYNLCVPMVNGDCEMSSGIDSIPFKHHFKKTQMSAMSNKAFRDWFIDESRKENVHFFVFGFLLEHCVMRTAMDIKESLHNLRSGNRVSVPLSLCGSRTSKQNQTGAGSIPWAVSLLNQHGIHTPDVLLGT